MTEDRQPLLMPPPLLTATVNNNVMGELVDAKFGRRNRDAASGWWGPDANWLLGTILPPFQRPVVWDEERMVRFVESAWLGLHLGTYAVNDATRAPIRKDASGQERYHSTDRWLIDGQQRLTAIDRYLDDAFPVFGHLWSDIGSRERRRFEDVTFAKARITLTNEHDLRDLYDRMNFGAVAHTEEQRALPRP